MFMLRHTAARTTITRSHGVVLKTNPFLRRYSAKAKFVTHEEMHAAVNNSMAELRREVVGLFDKLEFRLDSIEKRFDARFDKIEQEVRQVNHTLVLFNEGLGHKFENLCTRYIEDVLAAKGIVPETQLTVNYKEVDLDGIVHPDSKEIEIDVWCSSPLLLADCTTYLRQSEMKKVEKFVRTCKFIEKRYGKKPMAFFFVFGMHQSLVLPVEKICQDNGITLVRPCDM